MVLLSGHAEPPGSLGEIGARAEAARLVDHAESELRVGDALFRSQAIPLHGFGNVDVNAAPAVL
ncbi:hypothetical protein D3C83_174240 [compost metagenome]